MWELGCSIRIVLQLHLQACRPPGLLGFPPRTAEGRLRTAGQTTEGPRVHTTSAAPAAISVPLCNHTLKGSHSAFSTPGGLSTGALGQVGGHTANPRRLGSPQSLPPSPAAPPITNNQTNNRMMPTWTRCQPWKSTADQSWHSSGWRTQR